MTVLYIIFGAIMLWGLKQSWPKFSKVEKLFTVFVVLILVAFIFVAIDQVVPAAITVAAAVVLVAWMAKLQYFSS